MDGSGREEPNEREGSRHLDAADVVVTESVATIDVAPAIDPLDVAVLAVEALLAEDRTGWFAGDRTDRARQLAVLHDRVQAAHLFAIADLDADKAWTSDDAVSINGWLTDNTPVGASRASLTARSARLLRRFPATAAALVAGDLSVAKLELIVRSVTPERVGLYKRDEATLLEAAGRVRLVDHFAIVVSRWAKLADDDIADAEATEARRRQRLHLSLSGDRAYINGELTADSYATLAAALDAIDRPDGDQVEGHTRTQSERAADNLIEMARRIVNDEVTRGSGTGAAVQVVIDAELLALTLRSPGTDGEGSEPESSPNDNQAVAVDLLDARSSIIGVGPVPLETVSRLLCDSHVARAIMKGKSEVLDLGRNARYFSASQRRAIVLRDGGCIAQGCDRGPDWCEIHHLRPWEAGGNTDQANGALLCSRHHHLVHEGGWVVGHDDDGRFCLRKPDRRRPRHPRRLEVVEPTSLRGAFDGLLEQDRRTNAAA